MAETNANPLQFRLTIHSHSEHERCKFMDFRSVVNIFIVFICFVIFGNHFAAIWFVGRLPKFAAMKSYTKSFLNIFENPSCLMLIYLIMSINSARFNMFNVNTQSFHHKWMDCRLKSSKTTAASREYGRCNIVCLTTLTAFRISQPVISMTLVSV